jgi:hypothetical protein
MLGPRGVSEVGPSSARGRYVLNAHRPYGKLGSVSQLGVAAGKRGSIRPPKTLSRGHLRVAARISAAQRVLEAALLSARERRSVKMSEVQ